jgi:hypothetical protein
MSDLMVSEATLRINGLARQMRRWKMSDDIVVRLRRTRADMIGTDDEEHYSDCHEAAHVIEELQDEITNLNELAKDRYCTMQTEIERLRAALAESCDENRTVVLEEGPFSTDMCPLAGRQQAEIEQLQAVVDAAKAARTTDEYGLLSVEKGWDLDKALAALEDSDE